jgi:cobalamin biosynthesis Mg chelatase CobN
LLLSVLAVLALACAPAQAREASELQYEPEVPTVPQEESPGGSHNGGSNDGGNGNGGNGGEAEAEKANTPGGGGSGGDNGSQGGGSHTGQGNQGPTGNGGQRESGSVGSGVALGEGKTPTDLGEKTSATSDEGSSPLVPILIAIVVLAAISIGAFYYRQRRDAGSSISPKAS